MPGQHDVVSRTDFADDQRRQTRPSRDLARRRTDDPDPLPLGFGEQLGRRRLHQPNGIEPRLGDQFQRLAPIAQHTRKERMAVDQQHRAVELHFVRDRFRAGCGAGPPDASGAIAIALRPAAERVVLHKGRLLWWFVRRTRRGTLRHAHDAAHLQVVDRQIGRAGAAINIEHHLIEIRPARIDLARELSIEHPKADVAIRGGRC